MHKSSPPVEVRSLIVFVLVLASGVLPASAQLYSGSIAGTVTDPSGAVIVSAHVTATDIDKGFKFPGKTDNAGRYLLRNIPPGRYTISVEAPSFESQLQTGIVIAVTQNASVNFALKVGEASQTIEVQAQHVELQTEDAVTGQVVNRTFVNNLPLVGRNFSNLAYLAPGVNETNAPGTQGSNGGINFNSNGSRNSTADVLIDGASATNFEQNSGLQNVPYTPSVDSVEEFKVQQSNFTAEYGFAGGTIINVVTRSGTNRFHGSVYDFLRNSATDANLWFNPQNDPIAALKEKQLRLHRGRPHQERQDLFLLRLRGHERNLGRQLGRHGRSLFVRKRRRSVPRWAASPG